MKSDDRPPYAEGPYRKYYDEWLWSEEGLRVQILEAQSHYNGHLDLILDLYITGAPLAVFQQLGMSGVIRK